MRYYFLLAAALLAFGVPATAQSGIDTFGLQLQRYSYPFPVRYLRLTVQQQKVQLAYMDVKPAKPNGGTVLLLHGKNFPAAYWEGTIRALTAAGFRVVAPDALGFGKSSKPVIQYSFAQLAYLDKLLLDSLKIDEVSVIGHSMGGMLATRFVLSYPERTKSLVLEDPLGLEDWRAKGAPVLPADSFYAQEKKSTLISILTYHRTNYYPNWKVEYLKWPQIQASYLKIRQADQYAWVSALTTEMILTQPVLYEFSLIRTPTLVVVGKEDKTKVVRSAPADVWRALGNYPVLAKRTADAIPGAKLITYDNVGHVPHLEIPDKFHADLVAFLEAQQ